jgi:polyisoprenyl-phosphate glycosyltransferase
MQGKHPIPRYGVKEATAAADDLDMHAEELRLLGSTVIDSGIAPAEVATIASRIDAVIRRQADAIGAPASRSISKSVPLLGVQHFRAGESEQMSTADTARTRAAATERAERESPALSVIIPVFGCSRSLWPLHARLTAVLADLVDSYEIIFVDDRGSDGSWEILANLAAADRRVVACRLSRNFGQQVAITAGLARCRGDHAVVMDCDLQDPPEFIPQLYAAAMAGNSIVYARRKSAYQSLFRRLTNRLYFKALSWISKQSLDGELGAFSIISRPVIEAFLRFGERDRHYVLILKWLGFTNITLDYDRDERTAGRSSYTLGRLLAHALSGVFFSTTRLLRWVIYSGLSLSLVGGILTIFYTLRYFLIGASPGWTSLIVVELLIGGMVIISVGVTGLYIARIFEAVQQRPLYVIEEEIRGQVAARDVSPPLRVASD